VSSNIIAVGCTFFSLFQIIISLEWFQLPYKIDNCQN